MTDRIRSTDPVARIRAQVEQQLAAHAHLKHDPEAFARAVALTLSQGWSLTVDELVEALGSVLEVEDDVNDLRDMLIKTLDDRGELRIRAAEALARARASNDDGED